NLVPLSLDGLHFAPNRKIDTILELLITLLCRRAVLQSGAINAPWSNLTPEKSRKISQQLINDCGCQVKPR
ncbi:MAG: hypothetical protein ACK559_18730, partial [bacterium]